jgi:hypothetical protein
MLSLNAACSRGLSMRIIRADLMSEVGGPSSLATSIAVIRYCGHNSVIGNLAGKSTIDPSTLFTKRA